MKACFQIAECSLSSAKIILKVQSKFIKMFKDVLFVQKNM